MKNLNHPNYLAAIDHETNRIFVLAPPNLSAIKINGTWQACEPLADEEIPFFTLITDYDFALKLVDEAREALSAKAN